MRGHAFSKHVSRYTNSPICCPSRSTILTGRYVHNVYVKNNSISGNCSSSSWQNNFEPYSLANMLKNKGNYNTFYGGKYLNQYGSKEAGGITHVPPGYDWWIGLEGNSQYYNYTLSINGTGKYFEDAYLTDLLKSYALDFLNQEHIKHNPFFMMVSPPASHAPFSPAPRHKGVFAGTEAPRPISFNFSSPDKHWLITMPPQHLPTDVSSLDKIHQSRLETLLAVDEMVDDIFKKLKEVGVLDDTYVILTSDHGFHIGEFAQPWDKRQPYETDIKVPLMIRGPNVPTKTITEPISLVDLAATVMDLAIGNSPEDMDGKSFAKTLTGAKNEKSLHPKYLFVEYYGEGQPEYIDDGCPYSENLSQCSLLNWCKCQDSKNNTYTCVKYIMENINLKYCRFYDDVGFREAYDLAKDPFELINIYSKLNEELIQHLEKAIDQYLNELQQKDDAIEVLLLTS
ncbi:n-acetylglucosamine-6-sulfatase family member [Holotrichia oblita]|uniref:N-acetylglucosamine-6-sulfatase family member n=1 Tax=Holotrichia oblita TaxID=644536 RepID=A0ACB9SQD9_HOLOL|nr:n-acetylglucosamine-6-sulfatase family member [Holotrichia oblita]